MIKKKDRSIAIVMTILLIFALLPMLPEKVYAKGNTMRFDTYADTNFTIKNAAGKTLSWNKKTAQFSGDMKVYRFSGEGTSITVEIDQSDSLTYHPAAGNNSVRFAVWSNTISGYTYAKKVDSISYSHGNGTNQVIVKGNNTTFESSLLARNNQNMDVTLVGNTKGSAILTDINEEMIVSGTDGKFSLEADDLKWKVNSIKKGAYYLSNEEGHFKITGKEIEAEGAIQISSDTTANIEDFVVYEHGGTSLLLTWNQVEGAQGYEVYRQDSLSTPYEMIKDNKGYGTNYYCDTGLQTEFLYTYKIKPYAIDKTGKKIFLKDSHEVSAVIGSSMIFGNAQEIILDQTGTVIETEGNSLIIQANINSGGKMLLVSTIRWYSSNQKIATVDETGNVRFIGKGECFIWAKAHNGINSEKVKVVVN